MSPLNKVEMRGRVGSHTIQLKDDGRWEGWFDLHVGTRYAGNGGYQPMVFECRVVEDGKGVKDLGAGIGGKIVQITGRLYQYQVLDRNGCYISVKSLDIIGGPEDKLEFEEDRV